MRLRWVLVLAMFLSTIHALAQEAHTPITAANAAQLAELGRASFSLEPLLAADGLALSPDGHTLALATSEGILLADIADLLADGTIRGFIGDDATALRPAHPFQMPRFSPDGLHIVALSGIVRQPASLYVWQTDRAEPLQRYDRRPGEYYQSLLFRPGTDWVYMSYFLDPVRLGNPEGRVPTGGFGQVPVTALRPFELFNQSQPNAQFTLESFSDDGARLHFLTENVETQMVHHHVLDIKGGVEIEPVFTGPPDAILSPDWSHAAWRDGTTLMLRDIAAGPTTEIPVNADVITSLGFSPDSALLVGATFSGEFGSLRLWDVASGDEVAVLALGEFDVLDVFFTPDMTRLFAHVAAAMPREPGPEQLVVWGVPSKL